MQPLRRLYALVALVLVGTAYTVDGYLESKRLPEPPTACCQAQPEAAAEAHLIEG